MLTRHKVWFGTGVLAAAAGVLVGLNPGDGPTALRSGLSLPAGESGEAGEGAAAGALSRNLNSPSAAVTATADEGGEAGEHGVTLAPNGAQDFAGGSFDVALAQVLDGEGGKDGIGITPLLLENGAWRFSVPTLTGSQLTRAVSDNSLRSERHFAMYFERGGRYRGWSLSWAKTTMAHCPSRSGANYGVFDGECWVGTENAVAGTWAVRGDTLCLSPAPRGITQGKECVRAALMLSSLVFFGSDGHMLGKGAELLRGDNAGRERSK